MASKTENDLAGVASLLGDMFGVSEIGNAMRKAGFKPPAPETAKKEEPSTLDKCEKCGVYVLGKEHACSVDLAETLPAEPPSHSEIPRERSEGPTFYCAFTEAGKFVGAFVSPYQACEAAGSNGFTKRLPAGKIPKE